MLRQRIIREEIGTISNKLIELIESIIIKITSDTDVIWTGFNTVDELKMDLNQLIQGIKNNDIKAYDKLQLLFDPTGTIQELSISNGWGEEFIRLSTIFDDLMNKIKNQ